MKYLFEIKNAKYSIFEYDKNYKFLKNNSIRLE